MASLLQPDRVVYLVRGEKKIRAPISQLYFCRYCSELRSLECVSHEVRSHYSLVVVSSLLAKSAATLLLADWLVALTGRRDLWSHVWCCMVEPLVNQSVLLSLCSSLAVNVGLTSAAVRVSTSGLHARTC